MPFFFALTGKPIVPRVGLPAMAQSGASSGTAGINFRNGEQSYQLFRSTQGEVQLRQKEENEDKWRILFTGKRSADEDLRKQFHFSYHHLAAATFLREGEIFEFLARQPADRRDVLNALLGIDRLMEVRQRFLEGRRVARREEKRIQDHQRSMRVTTVKNHREDIERVEAELKNLEGEYELLSGKAGEGGDTVLVAELTQAHERFQKEIDGLIQERASVLSGFTDVDHLRTSIKEIETATASASGLEKQRDELIQGIGSLSSQIQTLSGRMRNLAPITRQRSRTLPHLSSAGTTENYCRNPCQERIGESCKPKGT